MTSAGIFLIQLPGVNVQFCTVVVLYTEQDCTTYAEISLLETVFRQRCFTVHYKVDISVRFTRKLFESEYNYKKFFIDKLFLIKTITYHVTCQKI